jgi:hypothetical protein
LSIVKLRPQKDFYIGSKHGGLSVGAKPNLPSQTWAALAANKIFVLSNIVELVLITF